MATEYATDLASRYGATVHVLCVARMVGSSYRCRNAL
nr:hypothetical protein [Halogeometricum borinquense]